jgi:hypothetical protein
MFDRSRLKHLHLKSSRTSVSMFDITITVFSGTVILVKNEMGIIAIID